MFSRLHDMAASLFRGGFFHIVGAGTINKVLSALLGIVIVRLLPQDNYGVYAYAQNVMSFFILFNGLGAASAILQLCSSEDGDVEQAVYLYGFRSGCCVDLLIAIAMLIIGLVVVFPISGSGPLFSLLCLYPLATLVMELRLTKLRTELRNREYSILTNIQTVLNVVFSIGGAFVLDAVGLILGQYIALGLSILVGVRFFPSKRESKSTALSREVKHSFWKIALTQSLNNGLSQALSLLSVFFVGMLLVSESDLALYKASTLVPFALAFIPSMVAVYVYPRFAIHRRDREWTIRSYARWTVLLLVGMLLACLLGCLFSESIMILLFGEDYAAASGSFCVLMIGSFFMNGFGRLAGNLLVVQMKLLTNTVIAVIGLALTVTLSFALIPSLGIMGAAFAWSGTVSVMGLLTFSAYCIVIARLGNKTNEA